MTTTAGNLLQRTDSTKCCLGGYNQPCCLWALGHVGLQRNPLSSVPDEVGRKQFQHFHLACAEYEAGPLLRQIPGDRFARCVGGLDDQDLLGWRPVWS